MFNGNCAANECILFLRTFKGGENIGMGMLMSEVYKGVSMFPGVLMCAAWMRSMPWPQASAAASYIITCICSIIYHFNFAVSHQLNPKYLRLDLFGQQLGLLCNIYNSVLGPSGAMMLLPGIAMCAITDLGDDRERIVAYAASGTNILLASCFSVSFILQWLFAFSCFASGRHNMWHFMCHIVIHQYFQALPPLGLV